MTKLIGLVVLCSLAFSTQDETGKIISNKIPEAASEKEPTPRIYESKIDEYVELLRTIMLNGLPDLKVPPLDPLEIENYAMSFNSEALSGNLNISNLKMTGLADFIASGTVQLADRILKLDLNIPALEVITEYSGDLNILGMVHLYGSGNISIVIKNLDLHGDFKIKLIPKRKIDSLVLVTQLPSIEIKITGLFNDEYMSDLISRQLTDTLTTLGREEKERIDKILHDLLWDVVVKYINPMLEKAKYNHVDDNQEIYKNFVMAITQKMQTLTKYVSSKKIMN